jgi:hypothetical protein
VTQDGGVNVADAIDGDLSAPGTSDPGIALRRSRGTGLPEARAKATCREWLRSSGSGRRVPGRLSMATQAGLLSCTAMVIAGYA